MAMYSIRIHSRYNKLESFVRSLPETFDASGTLLFRKRNVVKMFEAEGMRLVVKKFRCPNALQRVAYTFFKPSKAVRAYMHADLFTSKGISTPAAVAYLQMKQGGLVSEGYFVSLCGYGCSVRECLLPGGSSQEFAVHNYGDADMQLIDNVAAFIANIHDKDVIHGDLNISNLLCDKAKDGNVRLCVIDNDRARLCHPTRSQCLSDLMRATHNRHLLSIITTMYARHRGWDAAECNTAVMNKLDSFEKRKLLKRKLKGLGKTKNTL